MDTSTGEGRVSVYITHIHMGNAALLINTLKVLLWSFFTFSNAVELFFYVWVPVLFISHMHVHTNPGFTLFH